MKLKLVIGDYDTCYLQALTHYLLTRNELDLSLYTFSETNLLHEFIQNNTIDILLVSPKLITDELTLLEDVCPILLHEGQIPVELNQYPYVEKFQSAPKLINEVIHIFSDNNTEVYITPDNKQSSKLIGVYSPIGGSGKTTIAIGLSKIYSMRKSKTLLINLESFSNYKEHFNSDTAQDISDLLYYAKQKNENLCLKLKGLINHDISSGLDYLYSSQCCAAYEDITEAEWAYLFNILKNKTDYNNIIIDFSSGFGKMNRTLLNLCDHIILITNTEPRCKAKTENFFKNLELMSMDYIKSMIIPVSNYFRACYEPYYSKEIYGYKVLYTIPYDALLSGSITLNSVFGQAVSNIANTISNGGDNRVGSTNIE